MTSEAVVVVVTARLCLRRTLYRQALGGELVDSSREIASQPSTMSLDTHRQIRFQAGGGRALH